jgi:glutamate N-acetyltransferase/amino-acid N-acetyltransferase
MATTGAHRAPRRPDDSSQDRTSKEAAMSVTHPAGFVAAGVAAGLKSSAARTSPWSSTRAPPSTPPPSSPPTGARPTRCCGARRSSRTASCAPSSSTPAAPTATPAPRASRPPTPSPSGSPRRLGIGAIDVVVCSTGLIGLANPRQNLLDGVDAAYAALATAGGATPPGDHDHRLGAKQVVVEGDGWSIGGMAKGAGMLAPAAGHDARRHHHRRRRPGRRARPALRAATRVSFDRLDSDGCMSTNDTVTLMASGASGITPTAEEFTEALTEAAPTWPCSCSPTPRAPTTRSRSRSSTRRPRTTRSRSAGASRGQQPVQGAIFGKDPNWGRVLASVGTTRRRLRPGRPRRRDQRRLGVPRQSAPPPTRTVDLKPRRSPSPSTSSPATRPRPSGPTT